MYSALTTLIDRLDNSAIAKTNVIRWGCPIPSFGDLSNARVATLGLNPSNREFVDSSGNELQGARRRFHTLKSLGLKSWSDVDARHLYMILEACRTYFFVNPYDKWFKRLDLIISGTSATYYDTLFCKTSFGACHLDLIPYATTLKWAELTSQERALLFTYAGDTLGLLLRDSPVHTLILNGKSVVEHFQEIAAIRLEKQEMPAWSLPRQTTPDVTGIAYTGVIDSLLNIRLGRKVLVLGYNHNLQSSFGVTREIMHAIRKWIVHASSETIQ